MRVSFRRSLLIVLALALAVRLLTIFLTPGFTPETDARDYDRHGVSIAVDGNYPSTVLAPAGGPTAFRPPAMPVALAAVYTVVGTDSERSRWRAARILEALLGTVAVALTALIALRLWGPAAGLLSALIAALYPPLVLVGSSIMAEPLYIVLVLGAVLSALLSRDAQHPVRWAALAGGLVGLAALTRSNGLAALPPLAVLVWATRPRWSRRALAVPAVLLAVAVLMLVPWGARNASVLDAFVPVSTQSGYALAGTFNDEAREHPRFPTIWVPPWRVEAMQTAYRDRGLDEVELSAELRERAVDYARERPGYVGEVVGHNVLRLLNLEGPAIERYLAPLEGYPVELVNTSVYAFWLLALIAAGGAFTRAARRAPVALWGVPLFTALSCVLFLGLTRYRSPADPFVVMLAALGLLAAWDRLHRRLPSPQWPRM
jgi:4-amino-4-deoxy-L-arabinose transferase-like glycosyltransferase